ncbi:MAG: Toluene efflux pump periplasmic linker protein TtgG precursor [Alphaproteobacteria bacterium ADurb.Bin438]|nr:MAG: Toluene efflux pump periplasmic linker protein TtgG precursor [Alphaproteobacteria bacterium ADurb.Bin438]
MSRTYPGVTSALNNANIAFEVSGKLNELKVDVGSKVKKGDLLAKLDLRDFENSFLRAKSEYKRAKSHYERIEKAAKSNAVSKQDLTNALATFEEAEASYKIAKKVLEDGALYAPFDGEIVGKYVEQFENINAKQPILRIVDDSKIEMTVDLPERMRLAIGAVKDVWVRLDAFKDVIISAEIVNIGSEPSELTRTYPITVRFEKPEDLKIISGMVGEAGGFVNLKKDDFYTTIPSTSLLKEGEKVFVYKIEKGTNILKKQEITLFNRFPLKGDGVPVRGLNPDDVIVSAGVSSVIEGQKVKVK